MDLAQAPAVRVHFVRSQPCGARGVVGGHVRRHFMHDHTGAAFVLERTGFVGGFGLPASSRDVFLWMNIDDAKPEFSVIGAEVRQPERSHGARV